MASKFASALRKANQNMRFRSETAKGKERKEGGGVTKFKTTVSRHGNQALRQQQEGKKKILTRLEPSIRRNS